MRVLSKRAYFVLFLLFISLTFTGCRRQPEAYDTNTSVPKGDPAFVPLTTSWVIDQTGHLSQTTMKTASATCQKLQDDGIAEMVVILINGVRQPDEWATHYGRWLKLGSRGLSTEGGNNGVVWLIRPDARERITISVGRGLPQFTTVDYGKIMDDALEYINFGNYDKGVLVLVNETAQRLRQLAGKGKTP
ncbi:MAG TPA: TPM domain-containing protein [Armatimonadota bacterium]